MIPDPATSTGIYITRPVLTRTQVAMTANTSPRHVRKVFAAKKDSGPSMTSAAPLSRPPSPPPMTATSSSPATTLSASPTAAPRTTQYQYQAGGEDQAPTKQLLGWIFEGKLDLITLFATCPPIIFKELVKRLRRRRVEMGSFEQVADGSQPNERLSLAFPCVTLTFS